MVDALLSAAAESFDDNNNEDFVLVREEHHQAPLRFCEFCNSSNTPTWRRGPAGKGSLCNACGIKWRLRKRLKKNEKGESSSSPSPTLPPIIIPEKKVSPFVPVRPPKKRKEYEINSDGFEDANYTPHPVPRDSKRKRYFCKYCEKTFSLSQFRNSQQFGAHCSNCSRRPRADGLIYEEPRDPARRKFYDSPYGSPTERSSPDALDPPMPTNRDALFLRLLHVVEHQLVDIHELSDIKGELSSLKTELVAREEARQNELGAIRVQFQEEIADLRMDLKQSVADYEQLAAHRLMEMEQTMRIRGGLLF